MNGHTGHLQFDESSLKTNVGGQVLPDLLRHFTQCFSLLIIGKNIINIHHKRGFWCQLSTNSELIC